MGEELRDVPLSMFRDRYDSAEQGFFKDMNHYLSYPEFRDLLAGYSTQEFAFKKAAPLMSPTVFQLISGQLSTTGRRCKGYRCKANATVCRMLFLDSDTGLSFDEAVAIHAGLENFVYTTASNGTNDQRIRIVLPLRSMVEYETHRAALESWYGFIKGHKAPTWECDETKLNAYSLFYVPGLYNSAASNRFQYSPGVIHPASHWIENYPSPIVRKKAASGQQNVEPVEYHLSSEIDWTPPLTTIVEYRRQTEGRYAKLFGLAVSLGMSAINRGYAVTNEDLASVILEEQRRNPPSSHCYIYDQLVHETIPAAMVSARNNVPVPAFMRREAQIEADYNEMREILAQEEAEEAEEEEYDPEA